MKNHTQPWPVLTLAEDGLTCVMTGDNNLAIEPNPNYTGSVWFAIQRTFQILRPGDPMKSWFVDMTFGPETLVTVALRVPEHHVEIVHHIASVINARPLMKFEGDA